MDQERIKGTIDRIMEAVRYALGGAGGNSGMKDQGKSGKPDGQDRKPVGEVKDATTEAVE